MNPAWITMVGTFVSEAFSAIAAQSERKLQDAIAKLQTSAADLGSEYADALERRDKARADADEIPRPRDTERTMQSRYWASDEARDQEVKDGLAGLAQRESQRGKR